MADYVPKPDLEGINSPEQESRLKDAAILVAGFLAIVTGFYLILIPAVDWAFMQMSPQTEMRLFGRLLPENKKADAMPDEFKTLVASIVSTTELPLRVSIICDETANAFALPGGTIYLTSGLFKTLKTENGVAFVLSHEIGHFINRDHVRGVGRQVVYALGAAFFGFADVASLRAFDSVIARGFDRNQESSADRYAVKLTKQIYGHTWGAEEFFEEMTKDESTFSKTISRLSSTHPLSSERLEAIRKSQIGVRPELKTSKDHFKSWTDHCVPK